MKKLAGIFVLLLGLVVGLKLIPAELARGAALPGSDSGQAVLKTVVTSGRNANSIAYSITLVNTSGNPVSNIYVAGVIPSGTKFASVSNPAGASPGVASESVVAWLGGTIPAKGTLGPFIYKVEATAPQVGPTHAWIRWLSPSEGTAVSGDVYADFQLIKVKGVNTRYDHEKYPSGVVALTTTGKTGHQEDEIVTSGLTNVGVDEYVILEGAKHDSFENEITSWAWHLWNAPAGSASTLENANSQIARFKPDRVGEYQVHSAAKNVKGESTGSVITITAGEYAGISLCASCHDGSVEGAKDIMSTFPQTGHADKFDTTYASYTPDRDYCIRCHTVGYNETANNGGLDDAARASGWNSRLGSVVAWLKNGGWTVEDIKADRNLSRKINIQCENCHGPGATAHTATKSFSPAVCGQCHPQPIQWQYAAHAKVDSHTATNSGCARCHTGQGYVEEWVRGNPAVMPDAATPTKPANVPSLEQQSGISCAACHDPHEATHTFKKADGSPGSRQLRIVGKVTAPNGWEVDADEAATCVRCHANNRTQSVLAQFIAGDYVRATHENTQSDVFYGKGYYNYGGAIQTSNSFHTTFKEACITCHMAPNPAVAPGPDAKMGTSDDVKALSVGGHSWNMAAEWEGKEVENTAACATCHAGTTTFNRAAAGDYDGDGKIEGIEDEVKGLMAVLAAQLPKDPATGDVLASGINRSNTNEDQRKAMWNYFLVLRDGSNGIHNTSFTVQLLQKTYKQLTGRDVPGAALR